MRAAALGQLNEVAHELVEVGADVNYTDVAGDTPLIAASRSGHIAVVDRLLKHNADVDHANNAGRTALTIASAYGHLEVIDCLLIDGANVHHTDNDGETPLLTALYGGKLAIVERLLESQADVNHSNLTGFTPLMLASQHCDSSVVEYLLANEADVSYTNIAGNTALLCALSCQDPQMSMIVSLLTFKADVNHINNGLADSPLILASRRGCPTIVKHLLDSDANINYSNREGWSALSSSAGNLSIMRLLLERTADVNHADTIGQTTLMRAANRGHSMGVKLLLEHSANIDQQDMCKRTAITSAIFSRRLPALEYLMECKYASDVWKIKRDVFVQYPTLVREQWSTLAILWSTRTSDSENLLQILPIELLHVLLYSVFDVHFEER